jgi:predicted metal-dependent phosphoesterase TrpH
MKIDLHSHTYYSDGVLSPAELVSRAVTHKVDVLAITDHDTVLGLAEAQQIIATEQLPIQLIAGVEISTSWHEFEIHIVGLGIDPTDDLFQRRLATQQQRRIERAQEMSRRLTKHNVPECFEQVLALAHGGAITRTHFARHLVNIGKANSLSGVFKHYLARGKAGYVPNNWIELADAVQWIHDAGGIAVLAHPLKYKLNGKWLTRLMKEFSEAGGDAAEVASPQQTPVQKREIWRLCQQFKLVASVGSDFHQPTDWNELGRGLYMTDDIVPLWQAYPDLVAATVSAAAIGNVTISGA